MTMAPIPSLKANSEEKSMVAKQEVVMEKQRPMMLKDFLNDTSSVLCSDSFNKSEISIHDYSSVHCYSIHKRPIFKESNPPLTTTMKRHLQMESKEAKHMNLLRSRSLASSTTISSLQKASEAVFGAVKLFQFAPKEPLKAEEFSGQKQSRIRLLRTILRRVRERKPNIKLNQEHGKSLSTRFTAAMRNFSRRSRSSEKHDEECETTLRVRDIVRWRSFGDERFPVLDCCDCAEESEASEKEASDSSSSSSSTWSCPSSNLLCSSQSSDYSGDGDEIQDKELLSLQSLKSPNYPCSELGPSTMEASSKEIVILGASDSMGTTSCFSQNEREGVAIACLEEDECSEVYEKEQFSPVSVLDFPFEDEENASFERSLANIERTKQQLLQKLCRYENLAQLDPLDLEQRIASWEAEDSSEESGDNSLDLTGKTDYEDDAGLSEEHVKELLICFKTGVKAPRGAFNKLIYDTINEELGSFGFQGEQREEEEEIVKGVCSKIKAWELVEGGSYWYRNVWDEEKWRKYGEEMEEIVVETEGLVWDLLVEELMVDLV
ncbi:hypothetical protein AMTRI_Chr09g42720 [Amborella trichopoda]